MRRGLIELRRPSLRASVPGNRRPPSHPNRASQQNTHRQQTSTTTDEAEGQNSLFTRVVSQHKARLLPGLSRSRLALIILSTGYKLISTFNVTHRKDYG